MNSGAAFHPPSFGLAYVISDLHIGGATGYQIFESAPQFRALVKHILAEAVTLRSTDADARVLLVINGDFVDFLAEPQARVFNLVGADEMLKKMFQRTEFADVLAQLQKYVAAPGTHLVITLGNHDVELALPDTRRMLLRLLTNERPALEGKVELCFDGWGYRFEVGGRRALCLHGNEADIFNFTRYDELDRVIQDLYLFGKSEFGAHWVPSGGSWFVINAVNPIKKEFPFVDMLKPETSLMPAVLGILDPRKASYIAELGNMGAKAIENEALRPSSQRRMLSAPAGSVSLDEAERPLTHKLSQAEIEDRVEWALRKGKIDELIQLRAETDMLFWAELKAKVNAGLAYMKDKAIDLKDSVTAALSTAGEEAHLEALRQAIRWMLTDDPYEIGALEGADIAINKGVRGIYDVVFAGHTHFRRLTARPGGQGIYVNTGTWANLMSLTRSQVDGPNFKKIYRALRSGERAELKAAGLVRQECTVARMAREGRRVVVALGSVAGAGERPVQFPNQSKLNAGNRERPAARTGATP